MAVLDLDARAAKLGIDLSQVDFNSVILPPGENFGFESDDEDVYEDEEDFETGFGNIIVVDQLPVDNFKKVELIKEDGLSMPVDSDTSKTLGYCFIEFNTRQEAEKAKEKTNGYHLSKRGESDIILAVYTFDDIERLMNMNEEWEPPQTKPYVPNETMNLHTWLTDEKARDQFVVRCGPDTEVSWNDTRHLKSESVHKLQNWTESLVQWSPLGTYLVTLHKPGVAVCGGATNFKPLVHYKHPMVKLVDVSPGENYLVTYNSQTPNIPHDATQVDIKIFDVKSGRLMRGFQGSADEFSVEGYSVSWPVFKWAGGRDDRYFARLRKNTISVYETETFSLLDKRSMKVDNVVDICWSPTDYILALFVPELDDGNQPARVALVQLPSKVEIRQKNLFNVSDCKMYWQSNGDYLAVKVDRYGSKSKKSIESGFEIFRVKEKDIPVEVLELDNKKDKIIEFAWEPKGQRFAVIHGDLPRPDVSFYSMQTPGRVSKLVTLKAKQANALFWSPTGKHMIIADRLNGKLEFYNVDTLMTMATVDNFMATDIKWDPTGRYVATVVTSSVMEDGFYIWSLYGKLLYRTLKEQVFQFSWRPRPPSLLSEEKEKEVKMNLRQYVERYEEEDEDVLDLLSRQEEEKRRVMGEEWEMWINKWKKLHEEEKLQRQNLLGEEEEEEYCYETVEELIDVCEEVVSLEL
ncbi:hypothetical protein Bca52824_093869 [Brassica carinata]|uniref:Eukaryotic translation initiation factor 3 subunit B n=1 Tax=Brassica carinata TaxID=52824 RepID=A0A8X7P4Y0_BRACI|nr:hypothetical protein Bca52824_093869 [Brassica carinata]